MRMPSAIVVALAVSAASPAVIGASGASAAATQGSNGWSFAPASYVDPIVGTGFGPGGTGAIGTFPGADVASGMVQ